MPTYMDAAGNVIPKSTIGNNILFQDRQYEPETNFYYLRARHLDPIKGRFLQTDPMGYKDFMNLYQAYNMNPVNFVDPLGEDLFFRGNKWQWEPRTGGYQLLLKIEKTVKRKMDVYFKGDKIVLSEPGYVVGSIKDGAFYVFKVARFELTLYNQNKSVMKSKGYSGWVPDFKQGEERALETLEKIWPTIQKGNYYGDRNKLDRKGHDTYVGGLNNLRPYYGFQKIKNQPIKPEKGTIPYVVVGSVAINMVAVYGKFRLYLHPIEGEENVDRKKKNIYLHGSTSAKGTSHGFLNTGEDEKIIRYLWIIAIRNYNRKNKKKLQIAVAVEMDVEEPK